MQSMATCARRKHKKGTSRFNNTTRIAENGKESNMEIKKSAGQVQEQVRGSWRQNGHNCGLERTVHDLSRH